MIDIDTIELENNEHYVPIKTFKKDNVIYYLLGNVKNKDDICVRKEIKENGEAYISMLDSEEELQMALKELYNS